MKVNKKQLETLVLESLMKEISPNMTTKEISLSEGVDTGNPYDLNNPSNLDEFYRKAAEAWTVYCGQSANDAGVSNDNRVILYNLLESGEFAEKMNQIWSPNGLNVNKDGSDYYTNNPEDMEAHLEKMGYSKGDYTLSPGVASQGRFEQPYNNPETTMSLNEKESLQESIRQVVRDAMFGNKKNKGLIKKIEDLQGTKIDQRVDRVIYSNEELNNMSSDELVSLFSHMSHPRGRNW